jgi:hypothetical protein
MAVQAGSVAIRSLSGSGGLQRNREASMMCHRCRGLLIEEHCYDLLDHEISLRAWRCISCGNIVDSVILKNRREQKARLAMVEQARRLVGVSAA